MSEAPKIKPLAPRATVNKAQVFAAMDYQPTKPQEIVHAAGPHEYPGGAKWRVISAGCRTGKTVAACGEVVCAALAPTPRPVLIWIASATHVLASALHDMVVRAFRTSFPEHIVRHSDIEGELIVRNLAGEEVTIVRKSCERPQSLVAFGLDMLVVDECALLSQEAWTNLSTRLLDKDASVLLIGSPKGTGNVFARLLKRALRGDDPEWFGACIPTWSNPRIPRDEIRKARDSMTDIEFRENWGGEIVAHSGKAFDHDAIEACATGQFGKPRAGEIYVGGLDVAGAGGDRTVLTIARIGEEGRAEVVAVHAWTRLSFDLMVVRVRSILKKWNDAPVTVDQNGIGEPVLQQMVAAGIPAVGFTWTAASKAGFVKNAAVIIERHRVTLPHPSVCPTLFQELLDYEQLDTGGGAHPRYGAPAGQHDDHVASLLLVLGAYFKGTGGAPRLFIKGTDVDTGADENDVETTDDQEAEAPNPFQPRGDAVPDDDELTPRPVVRRSRFGLGHRFGGFGGGLGFRGR